MSHHLTLPYRAQVHQDHIDRQGAATYTTLNHKIESMPENLVQQFLPDYDSETKMPAVYKMEICNQCGFPGTLICEHASMLMTHRPGCTEFKPHMTLPGGQVGNLEAPIENCQGCLMICPFCKADLTGAVVEAKPKSKPKPRPKKAAPKKSTPKKKTTKK